MENSIWNREATAILQQRTQKRFLTQTVSGPSEQTGRRSGLPPETGIQKRPVIIEKPENGAWYVYDHTGRDMKCVSSSWTLSEDRPFYLPEDGRVVLVGEAGAAFTIRYAD